MNKNLIVVDIQFMFSDYLNQNYFEKLKHYVENKNWDSIIVIYNEKEYRDEEDKLEHIPDWLLNSATHVISKFINTNIYDNYVNDLMLHGFKVEKENKAWRKDDSLLLATPTVHELFFVPRELQKISKNLNECILIGGAVNYCLEDIKESLEYLGVKVNVEHNYTYHLEEQKDKVKNVTWASPKRITEKDK